MVCLDLVDSIGIKKKLYVGSDVVSEEYIERLANS